MDVIYNPDHALHNPPYELYDGVKVRYSETAARAEAIISRLRKDPRYRIRKPRHFPLTHLQRVHHAAYIKFLRERSSALPDGEILYPSHFMTDTYAPVSQHTYQAAVGAVDVALTAADTVLSGKRHTYGLCRPPGHHAAHTSMGGYCYFNNAAIAAEYLTRQGKNRVAILDIDFHHGNGTQAAFYDRNDVLYVSLHADPTVQYPYISGFKDEKGAGDGLGFTKNYPLLMSTNDTTYIQTLKRALRDIGNFTPDYLVVSAGFDTYAKDPIGGLDISIDCYPRIGQAIFGLGLPTLILQEGGYNIDALGEIAHGFLTGFVR